MASYTEDSVELREIMGKNIPVHRRSAGRGCYLRDRRLLAGWQEGLDAGKAA